MDRKDELAANLAALREEVNAAERAAGREPGSVAILPVTKFHPASDIALLSGLGVSTVGENREQEAKEKAEQLPGVSFAMIGQIQTKKANSVARWAAEVHSLDTVKLAHALDRGVALALERGDRATDVLPCLIQLSFDGDTDRGGVPLDDVAELVAEVEEAEHLLLDGFMVVPPLEADPVEVFETSKSVAENYADHLGRAMKLSAGMSGDFAQAIACGSDIVRVGTKLLGKRHLG